MAPPLSPEARTSLREVLKHIPQVREAHWLQLDPMVQTFEGQVAVGAVFMRRHDGMKAVVSIDDTLTEGVRWLHVSAGFKDHTPSWEDMCDVKRNLMGDVIAIQMHPPKAEEVNLHRHTLHLWHNLLGKTVPDEGGHDRMAVDRAASEGQVSVTQG